MNKRNSIFLFLYLGTLIFYAGMGIYGPPFFEYVKTADGTSIKVWGMISLLPFFTVALAHISATFSQRTE